MNEICSIKRIIKYVSDKEKSFFLICSLYTFGEVVYAIFGILMSKVMLELLYIDNSKGAFYFKVVFFFLTTMCFMGWIKNITISKSNTIITKIKNYFAKKLYGKILSMPYSYLEDAEFMDNNCSTFAVVEEYDRGIEGVCHILFRLPAYLLLGIFFVLVLSTLSPVVGIVVIIDWYFKYMSGKKFSRKMYEQKKEIGSSKRKVNYYYNASHDFGYGKDIRIFKLSRDISKEYRNEIQKYIDILKKLYRLQFDMESINVVVSFFCELLIFGILIFRVYNGVSIASFIMYLTAISTFKEYIKNINSDVNTLIRESVYINDFFEFLDNETLKVNGGKVSVKSMEAAAEIEFENVIFKYPKSERMVLDKINFKIEKGEKVAIVGANGEGKTTIIKLLMRFYTPLEGKIKINGIDINDYDVETLYSYYSVIFQDICVYPFSIRENIVCGDGTYEEADLMSCIKKVELCEKIEKLPGGIDSKLFKNFFDEGIELSGGEKQKLVIARALYKNAPIAIFDEPTSALDSIAEEKLYKNLCDILKDRTIIFVSHRLTSIRFCDKIMFFKNGILSEYGTYDELMALRGGFYEMYKKQGIYYEKQI